MKKAVTARALISCKLSKMGFSQEKHYEAFLLLSVKSGSIEIFIIMSLNEF